MNVLHDFQTVDLKGVRGRRSRWQVGGGLLMWRVERVETR